MRRAQDRRSPPLTIDEACAKGGPLYAHFLPRNVGALPELANDLYARLVREQEDAAAAAVQHWLDHYREKDGFRRFEELCGILRTHAAAASAALEWLHREQ